MRLYLIVLCLAWLLTSCDNVGRAVVGVKPMEGGPALCKEPLACASLSVDPPSAVADSKEPVDLAACMLAAVRLCNRPAVSGGGQCPEVPEDLSLTLSEAEGADALHVLSCRAVRLRHTSDDGSALLQIALDAWTDVRLDVESTEPMTLELSGGKLLDVSLALHGPITLRLLDVGEGSEVRVLADDSGAHVELMRAVLSRVLLSAPDGDVLVRRSQLQSLAIEAERVDVESSYVLDASWQAHSLSATDSTLVRLHSEAERSVLSACTVENASFLGCQSLSTIDGFYRSIQLSACAEEAAIYGSDVTQAQIEGDLILDRASLREAVLGVGELGAITTWDSSVADVSFCSDQQALSIGGMSAARCAHCDLMETPTVLDACLASGASLRADSLAACPGLDKPPFCDDPQPQRMRPPLK